MMINDCLIAESFGPTGLRVSPLTLGTMTFADGQWRAGTDQARAIFRRYLDAGGNSIDTADVYGSGRSEELLGSLIAESDSRDSLVLATKASAPTRPEHANSRGNSRKHLLSALEGSLRRLGTDYVDVFWLHLWDGVTSPRDVMYSLNLMVTSGKARTVGLSNVPAWYAAAAHQVATENGWEPPAALQMEYSLLERTVEAEHVPAACFYGMSLVPWSPLGNGFLTGKYRQGGAGMAGQGRLTQGYPDQRDHTDQHWRILDALNEISARTGHTSAQVALAWVMRQSTVATTIIGATSVEQLEANLQSAQLELPSEAEDALTAVSRPALGSPYRLLSPTLR